MNIHLTRKQATFLLDLLQRDVEVNAPRDLAGNFTVPKWIGEIALNLSNIAKLKNNGFEAVDPSEELTITGEAEETKSPIILLN
jgi:hypothetical protein